MRLNLKQISLPLLSTILTITATIGCSTGRVPVTPGVIPQEEYVTAEDEAYGHQVLSSLIANYPMSRDDKYINRIRRLVNNLAKAAHADKHPWNVFVLQGDNIVNAAATRGNYVFVWTGMINMAQSDGELATVIAHEIGHLLANHTKQTPQEEANQIMAQASGEIAGRVVAMQPEYAALAQLASILVSETIKAIAVNPESQRVEMEADHIGFFLMADAGYNPNEALTLWSKMAGASSIPGMGMQFLSSHPASEDRLEALRTLLPEALARQKRSQSSEKKDRKTKVGSSNSATAEEDSFVLN